MGKNLITLLFAFTLIASASWELDFDDDYSSASSMFSPLSLSPLAWWKADNNALDYYNVRNGAWAGTETYTNGINSSAFNFSPNSVVNCGTNYQITSELTICGWVKPETYIGVSLSRFLGADDRFMLFNSGGNLAFFGSGINAGFTPAIQVLTNEWTHIAVTYKDGENIKGFKNGVYGGSITKTGNLTSLGTVPFTIGNRADLARQFLGRVDDVLIFNRALSTNEIQRLYQWRQ